MKGPVVYYEIKHIYGTDLSSTKKATELRQNILEEISLGFNVELEFKDVRSITNGWARNLLGIIFKEKGKDFLKKHIILTNMSTSVRTTLLEGIEDVLV